MDKENCKILADELICNMNKQFAQGVKGKQNKTKHLGNFIPHWVSNK